MLYLIEILHQTTTTGTYTVLVHGCILSKFYIKPQLIVSKRHEYRGCILSKFYIKPQHCKRSRNRTVCCILSKFYIKPQPWFGRQWLSSVVSYRNSTSNHNCCRCSTTWPTGCILSKFYIKPQHACGRCRSRGCCILSKFYIKPQPSGLILIDKVLLTGCLPL